MKKLLMCSLGLAALNVQAQELKANVKLELENVPAKVITYLINDATNEEIIDTLNVANNAVSIQHKSDKAMTLYVISTDRKSIVNQVLLIPDSPITITAKNGGVLKIDGEGNFYKDYEEAVGAISEMRKELSALGSAYNDLRDDKSPEAEAKRKEINDAYDALEPKVMEKIEAYAKENANKEGAVYYLLPRISNEVEYIDALPSEVRNGILEGYLTSSKKGALARQKREEERKKAEEKLQPGMMAPDFTLPDLNGKPLALSDLRGKYVILDFWGGWCIWCIRGVPKMKEYYAKYSDKMEILGIDCNEKEEAWRKAVAKHELPWKHVYNAKGETDITPMYAIQGYPTKAIIDPEGKIVKIIVGEDPKFYEYLDELMGK